MVNDNILYDKLHINFFNNYFMQIDINQIQLKPSWVQQGPKRSLSYNDLKKKRLIRSQKSKTKLKPEMSEKKIIRTEKKNHNQHFSLAISSTQQKTYHAVKNQNPADHSKNAFDQIRQKAKTKKYSFSKPFYTDRNPDIQSKKTSFIEKQTAKNHKITALYDSIQLAGNQKQLIKQIISKKKSQRRLIKFEEIRAQLKKSKSKSKIIIHEDQTTSGSINRTSPLRQASQTSKSRTNIRINKFQTTKEKPYTVAAITDKGNTSQLQRYQTVQLSNKDNLELKNCASRRKLKIVDFQTERTQTELVKNVKMQSKLKFHRKLRKTNSEIVIKTKQPQYNHEKYKTKIQAKAILKSAQKKQNKSTLDVLKQTQQSPRLLKANQQKDVKINLNSMEEPHNEDLITKDFQLSAINISEIQIKKEQSFNDIESELNIVQAIQAQQLEFLMKKVKPEQKKYTDSNLKKQLKLDKSINKKNDISSYKVQNVENIQNLSNILDFVALPTKEMKVKINRCSTKIGKKKNDLEKFKKIFPMNFFNN